MYTATKKVSGFCHFVTKAKFFPRKKASNVCTANMEAFMEQKMGINYNMLINTDSYRACCLAHNKNESTILIKIF